MNIRLPRTKIHSKDSKYKIYFTCSLLHIPYLKDLTLHSILHFRKCKLHVTQFQIHCHSYALQQQQQHFNNNRFSYKPLTKFAHFQNKFYIHYLYYTFSYEAILYSFIKLIIEAFNHIILQLFILFAKSNCAFTSLAY